MTLIVCPDCNKEVSSLAEICLHCGRPMSTDIKCPNCKSTDIHKISLTNKLGSTLVFGIFAANKLTKTYECDDCEFRW